MKTMTYKGYAARVEYSDEDFCFVGRIAGIKDVVGFHAESVTELKAAFQEAADDYLATCKKLNRTPQKPYPDKLILEIPPDVHAHVALMAESHGKSLNQWAIDVLADAV